MKSQFVISRVFTSYLVAVIGNEVVVEPLLTPKRSRASRTIADSLQIIANAKLMLAYSKEPEQYLKEYFKSKGWMIEDAP
jgi:hypothetical protein